ncbi:hypothetical protein N231_03285 [Geobacillus stearothermophilus ATCC 12980]|jgi:hypothetical protein|nr:hypothetical protein N231_03285 [Geobacillus stearothermophilus ATCC 12980]
MRILEKNAEFHRHTIYYFFLLKIKFISCNIGMYIRRVTRKNKDGTTVAYLQLAHNEWDPKAK